MKFAYESLEACPVECRLWRPSFGGFHRVKNKAVDFAVEVINTVENISTDRKHYRLLEQIEACSTSVSMNIAEGKGRFSNKEFVQYLYISRGSLYEAMTLLEIFRRKKWISDDQYSQLESSGKEIVSMIKGLINSLSPTNK
jgi:four helix bundle protein